MEKEGLGVATNVFDFDGMRLSDAEIASDAVGVGTCDRTEGDRVPTERDDVFVKLVEPEGVGVAGGVIVELVVAEVDLLRIGAEIDAVALGNVEVFSVVNVFFVSVKELLRIFVGVSEDDALGDPENDDEAIFDGVWGVAVSVTSELGVPRERDNVAVTSLERLTLDEREAPHAEGDDEILPRREFDAPRSRETDMLSDMTLESDMFDVRDDV